MSLNNVKFNIKIFCLDKLYYEFKNKSSSEIVEIIKENHKKHIYVNNDDLSIVKPTLKSFEADEYNFYSYCYNQPKNQDYWKLFLPDELTQNQKFNILEFSYVLFIVFKGNIYCVIGGSGINVIKKFIDPYFGIDLYQHFAKPNDDISISINTRGVTGNLSERSNTFNYNQSVNSSLDYAEIPKKIKVIIRKELKDGLFKKYNLDSEMSTLEIGAYFCLKKKINFEELKELIKDIHNIRQDKSNYIQLTLFNKVTDEKLIEHLDDFLKDKIADDIILHNTPTYLNSLNNDIIELVNTNKIEKFYECDAFSIKLKWQRKLSDLIVHDRNKLYYECTKYINNNLVDKNDRFKIKGKLYELSITGIINEKEITYGTFFSHINAEITLNNDKYFRIDNQWFYLDNKFIEQIRHEAINYYKLYKLDRTILNPWPDNIDEDSYNKSHTTSNYFILDKVIKENIELCDILYIENDNIFLIHVKDDFNTQMRNLFSQITLSAKRLWNDINNVNGSEYFIKTVELYNARNTNKTINANELYDKIKNNDIKVNFIMAYNNRAYKGKNAVEKIESSESNIARFSLVQTVRDFINYRSFSLKLIDISEIN